MKNLIKTLIYVSLPILFSVGVRCEEVQLSDYIYTDHKDLLGGYSYAESAQGNSIIKPDGTLLYAPGKYYVKYYDEYEKEHPRSYDVMHDPRPNPTFTWLYPQNASGNRFLVFDNENDLCTITDENGKPLIPFGDRYPYSKGKYYYICSYNVDGKYSFTVIDGTTGKYLATNVFKFYLSEDYAQEKVACMKYAYRYDNKTDFADRLVNIYFYDKGKLYDKIENAKITDYIDPEKADLSSYGYINSYGYITDKYGEDLWFIYAPMGLHNSVSKNPNTGEIDWYWDYDFIQRQDYSRKIIGTPDFDSSYYFKEKKIGGQIYFALFTNSETYTPPKFPEGKENIKSAYENGLINNTFLCHYNEGITKYDFSVILTKMYCKLKDKDVSDLLTDNLYSEVYFKDTRDAYCTFVYKKAFVDREGRNFVPSAILTEKQVCEILEDFSDRYGAYEEWCNVRTVLPSNQVCTREEACSEIYRLFECLTSTDHTQEINNIDVTVSPLYNVEQKPMGIEIYNALGLSLAFLLIMYLRNNRLTR